MNDIRLIGQTDEQGSATIVADRSALGRLIAVNLLLGTLEPGADLALLCSGPGGLVEVCDISGVEASGWHYPRILCNPEDPIVDHTHTKHMIAGTLQLEIVNGGAHRDGGAIAYVQEDN